MVCEACRSTVLRQADALVVAGKISAFSRDLSPIQIGCRGDARGRAFSVVGVLRKGREGVKWNEWYLVFADGGEGWLGEGNGFFELYDQPAVEGRFADFQDLHPGAAVGTSQGNWIVREAATARVLAADGELPFAVTQDGARPYADLRSEDGARTGTIDYADEVPALWVGRIMSLQALSLQGLRQFSSWVDAGFRNFMGPEVEVARKLDCPNCGGSLDLRNPGQTAHLGCPYCGSTLQVSDLGDDSTAQVVEAMRLSPWEPPVPLGSKGTLRGGEWEVIGAMSRSVTYDGVAYAWIEHFLWNPYRGQAFLTVDGRGHWNFVDRMTAPPQQVSSGGGSPRVRWKDQTYRHYSGATATVVRVLGEFSWQVRVGEQAYVADYVAPPEVVSVEQTDTERSWSHGTWIPAAEVNAAFGLQLPDARGVSANCPNPWTDQAVRRASVRNTAILLGVVLALWVIQGLRFPAETVLEQGWMADSVRPELWLSNAFEVPPGSSHNLQVQVETAVSRSEGQVQVALLNQDTGAAYFPISTVDDNKVTGLVTGVASGTYLARVELARPKNFKGGLGGRKTVELSVKRDLPNRAPLVVTLLFILLAPVGVAVARGSFEGRRWAESDYV